MSLITNNKSFSVPKGYEIIFQSFPEKTPKIFLVGERHESNWRKVNAEKLFSQAIIAKSALFCESVKSFRSLSTDCKNEILSDLFITDEQKELIELISGWDDQDIYLNPEDTNFINPRDACLSAYVAGVLGNDLVNDLRIPIKVNCEQSLSAKGILYKKEFEYRFKIYYKLQDDLMKKINALEDKTHNQFILWAKKFEQCGICYPYYPLFLEVKKELLEVKAEIELDQIELEKIPGGVFGKVPEEELSKFSMKLNEIGTTFLSILATLDKARNQNEELEKEYVHSDERLRADFPARTEQMKNTLLKVEKMEIEGNILFIAGSRHLKEDLYENTCGPDQRFSLNPVYNVLRDFPYPVIVLKPSQELIDNSQ